MKKTIEEYTEFFMLMLEQANKEFNNDEFITKFAVAFSEKIKIKSDLKINEVNRFYEEIKRTRYFLKHIDKEAWIEGLSYYSKVKIPELKIELAKDINENFLRLESFQFDNDQNKKFHNERNDLLHGSNIDNFNAERCFIVFIWIDSILGSIYRNEVILN